jgi:hypothetical protein
MHFFRGQPRASVIFPVPLPTLIYFTRSYTNLLDAFTLPIASISSATRHELPRPFRRQSSTLFYFTRSSLTFLNVAIGTITSICVSLTDHFIAELFFSTTRCMNRKRRRTAGVKVPKTAVNKLTGVIKKHVNAIGVRKRIGSRLSLNFLSALAFLYC